MGKGEGGWRGHAARREAIARDHEDPPSLSMCLRPHTRRRKEETRQCRIRRKQAAERIEKGTRQQGSLRG